LGYEEQWDYLYNAMWHRLFHIIKKDFLIDKREKQSFLTSILYLTTITFVVFRLFGSMSKPMQIAIFWILLLFTTISFISSSFSLMGSKRRLYYYQLYEPTEVYIAKFIANFFKAIIIGGILLLLFRVFGNFILEDLLLFGKSIVLTSLGITSALTLMSTLTVFSSDQNTLLTVLSLPLLLPILYLGIRVSMIAEKMVFDTAVNSNLLMLFGIDLIMVVLGMVFISLTWKS